MREVSQAVDVLFDGSEGVACWTLLMFYLSVVLESGDVVGGGLDAQDELVTDFALKFAVSSATMWCRGRDTNLGEDFIATQRGLE